VIIRESITIPGVSGGSEGFSRRFNWPDDRLSPRPSTEHPRDPDAHSTTATRDELIAILADMDTVRQAIALLFSHALAQTTDPDTMERGRRVALNFADAVARHRRDMALGDDGSQVG
jgi:hypothetical protein